MDETWITYVCKDDNQIMYYNEMTGERTATMPAGYVERDWIRVRTRYGTIFYVHPYRQRMQLKQPPDFAEDVDIIVPPPGRIESDVFAFSRILALTPSEAMFARMDAVLQRYNREVEEERQQRQRSCCTIL